MTIQPNTSSSRFLAGASLAALLLMLAPALPHTALAQSGLSDEQKADLTPAQWEAFAENTKVALASSNEGVKIDALRNIIWYGPQLDAKGSMTDVMSIYRNHPNPQVRRMAVVALGRMDSDFAISYLDLMAFREGNSMLRKTIRDVVHAAQAGKWDASPASLAQVHF